MEICESIVEALESHTTGLRFVAGYVWHVPAKCSELIMRCVEYQILTLSLPHHVTLVEIC
jgi:hypothetical protein